MRRVAFYSLVAVLLHRISPAIKPAVRNKSIFVSRAAYQGNLKKFHDVDIDVVNSGVFAYLEA